MAQHDYSAGEALELLMRKLGKVSPELLKCIKTAIDSGKNTEVSDIVDSRKEHVYRSVEPYTKEEALEVAYKVVKSHLIESRHFINTAYLDFCDLPIKCLDSRKSRRRSDLERNRKQTVCQTWQSQLVVDVEPETKLEKENLEDAVLRQTVESELNSLKDVLTHLKCLINYTRDDDGDPN